VVRITCLSYIERANFAALLSQKTSSVVTKYLFIFLLLGFNFIFLPELFNSPTSPQFVTEFDGCGSEDVLWRNDAHFFT